jgi:hypothetical protein
MSATLTGPALSLFETATAAPASAPGRGGAAPAPTAPTPAAPTHAALTRAAGVRPAHAGGRPTTLEERLTHAWHELAHAGEADCPMCHTTMSFNGAAGHCPSCGTTLS